jgi:hypothetical protein
MRKFLAFDLEIAKELPEDAADWKQHRPLGITCAATAWYSTYTGQAVTSPFCGEYDDGTPQPQMSVDDCQELVLTLERAVRHGYTIVTWNGASFDFDVLAEESGWPARCARLALAHVDMMYHFVCLKGYPLSLAAALEGMQVEGKTKGMNGALAPVEWSAGNYDKVLNYVMQDAKATLELAEAITRKQALLWTSKSGRGQIQTIPELLPVHAATALPKPNTKWMTRPLDRAQFTGWLPAALSVDET